MVACVTQPQESLAQEYVYYDGALQTLGPQKERHMRDVGWATRTAYPAIAALAKACDCELLARAESVAAFQSDLASRLFVLHGSDGELVASLAVMYGPRDIAIEALCLADAANHDVARSMLRRAKSLATGARANSYITYECNEMNAALLDVLRSEGFVAVKPYVLRGKFEGGMRDGYAMAWRNAKS